MSIKLLLVDDEEFTREGLIQYVNWNSLGITHVKGAANGVIALELFTSFQPDIILTDIKMPHMSGIQLARKIRELSSHCHIIFLSGYAEKEYLKSAIDLRVDAYIDKPATPDKVEHTLLQVVSSLKKEYENELQRKFLEQNLGQADDAVRGRIAHMLIDADIDCKKLHQDFSPSWFNWTDTGKYCALCLRIRFSDKDSFPPHIIRHYWEETCCLPPRNYYSDINDKKEVFFLTKDAAPSNLLQIITALQLQIQEKYHLKVQASIGPLVFSLKQIPYSYQTACNQLLYGDFYGLCNSTFVYPFISTEKSPSDITAKLYNRNDYESFFQQLQQKKYADFERLRQLFYKFYLTLPNTNKSNETYTWENFKKLSLVEYQEIFLKNSSAPNSITSVQEPKIRQAIHYISENYCQENLSVKMIADHVELSQNYFCTLFKQNTAMTVNDYIIKFRLEQTKQLLLHTNLKLYEIGEQVGIPNANYLNILFKKLYHTTPSKFRREIHKE